MLHTGASQLLQLLLLLLLLSVEPLGHDDGGGGGSVRSLVILEFTGCLRCGRCFLFQRSLRLFSSSSFFLSYNRQESARQ